MNRLTGVISLLFFLLAAAGSFACSKASQSYTPPEKKDLGNNQYEYVNSPLYQGDEAGAFDPAPGVPEAAVAKFLCSQARGDGAWEGALVPKSEWTDRLKRQLADWNEWKITKWQLRSLQIEGERAYLTVYFEIEYEGGLDDGEDSFELAKKDKVWYIVEPPT